MNTHEDTYADADHRFLSSVMMTVNALPAVAKGNAKQLERFNKEACKALTPYVRAFVFANILVTKNVANAHTNIRECARPTIEAAADEIRERVRGKHIVHIDLDKTPLVSPIDHSKPFDKAMLEFVNKLESDIWRFGKAKDIEAIERVLLTYLMPIGQHIGLTTQSAESAADVIDSIIDWMLEETTGATAS